MITKTKNRLWQNFTTKYLFIFLSVIVSANGVLIMVESSVYAAPAGDNVIISEVGYDTDGTKPASEWFELFNPTAGTIDISGWTISDNTATYTLPASTTIASRGHLLITNDIPAFQAIPAHAGIVPDLDTDVTISLSNSGDELTLSNGATVIDFVAWEGGIAGWDSAANSGDSVCRVSDTDTDSPTDVTVCDTPTPGTGIYVPATGNGSLATPFTALVQVYQATGGRHYAFNIGGNSFTSYVDTDHWTLVASGKSETDETSYSQTDSLALQSDKILNSTIMAGLDLTQIRMNATTGSVLPFDVTTSSAVFINRLKAFETLGDRGSVASNNEYTLWSGSNVSRMDASCNGVSGSLDVNIWHACGIGANLHWLPSVNNDGFQNNGDDANMNLWVRADDPADSPLYLWLKADAGVEEDTGNNAEDSDLVSAWLDQGGKSNNVLDSTSATTTDRPTLLIDDLNFNPTLNFDGNDSLVDINGIAGTSSHPDAHIYLVNRTDVRKSSSVFFEQSSSGHRISSHAPWGNGIVYWDYGRINSGGRETASYTSENGVYGANYLWTYVSSVTGGQEQSIARDGKILASDTTAKSMNGSNSSMTIGQGGGFINGNIAELMVFLEDHTPTQISKYNSYLALKYGLTLDQTVSTNYLASDETTIFWDSAAVNASTFNNDIFGIGRDDELALGQIKSKSVASDAVVTLMADAEGANNQNTIFVDIDDLEYLTIGNNNGAATWTATGAPTGSKILTRQWSVQETGEIGNVTLEFDVSDSDFNVPEPESGTSYYFVYDSDNDGDLDDETPILMTNTASNTWSINGINLNNGQAFTLLTPESFSVTLDQATTQADPAIVSPILFTVEFSLPINTGTFTNTDINTSNSSASGITVNSITEVAPNDGTTFEVSINATGTGSVIASIDTEKIDSLLGGQNTKSTTADNTVIFDNKPPQPFSVGAEITGAYTIDNPQITFSTTDDSAIDRYEVDIDGGGFSVQTSPYEPTLTAAASHTVTVRAYDAAGNFTESIVAYPPSVVINAPTSISNKDITDTTVLITGPNPITSIAVTGPISTPFTCNGSTLPLAGPLTSPVTCSGGTINTSGTLTVTATDGVTTGNNGQGYVIDITPPAALSIDTNLETDDIVGPTEISDVSITGSGAEANSTVSVTITDGTNNLGPIAATVNTDGTWSIVDQDFSSFNQGSIAILATETDQAGNAGTAVSRNIIIDTTAPSVPVIVAPNESDEVEETFNVTITCNEVDEIITLSNPNVTPNPTTATCLAVGNQAVELTFNSGHKGTAQTLTATLTDPQGNVSLPSTLNVFISDGDNISRDIESAAPNGGDANGDGIPDAEQIKVSALLNAENTQYNAITVGSPTCSSINQAASRRESELSIADTVRNYPVGLWDFTLECDAPGDSADIIIYLDKTYVTTNWKYHKYDEFGEIYADISANITYGTALVGADTVTTISYQITDGGPLDADGVENGFISDPAGPGVPVPIATSNGGSAKQKHVVNMCNPSDCTCKDLFPIGKDAAYNTYLQCYNNGQQSGIECAMQWALSKGYTKTLNNSCNKRVEQTNSVKTSTTEVVTNPITESNKCESVKHKRYPALRNSGLKTEQFTDTLKSNVAYKYLKDLAEQKIVNGDDNTLYARLDENISRGEVVKIITIARQDTLKTGNCLELSTFPDVAPTQWYHDFVQNLQYQDIVHGYADGRYRPNKNIVKAEIYKILAIGFGFITKEEANTISAARKTDWYVPYVEALETNISLPRSITKISMDTTMSRGQVFTLLSLVLENIDGLN